MTSLAVHGIIHPRKPMIIAILDMRNAEAEIVDLPSGGQGLQFRPGDGSLVTIIINHGTISVPDKEDHA
jgi:hypothetical protein